MIAGRKSEREAGKKSRGEKRKERVMARTKVEGRKKVMRGKQKEQKG